MSDIIICCLLQDTYMTEKVFSLIGKTKVCAFCLEADHVVKLLDTIICYLKENIGVNSGRVT